MAATITSAQKEILRNAEEIKKLKQTVFGNGDKGMDEVVRTIASDVEKMKPAISDISLVKRILFNYLGLDAQGNPLQGKKSESEADSFLNWIKEKILPGMVTRLIDTIVIIFVVLAVMHWQDIF